MIIIIIIIVIIIIIISAKPPVDFEGKKTAEVCLLSVVCCLLSVSVWDDHHWMGQSPEDKVEVEVEVEVV